MVGTLLGGHMATALRLVEEVSNIESEHAPIHRQAPEERIARDLDRINQAENATIKIAQVSLRWFKDWSVSYKINDYFLFRKLYFSSSQREIKRYQAPVTSPMSQLNEISIILPSGKNEREEIILTSDLQLKDLEKWRPKNWSFDMIRIPGSLIL